MCGGGCSPKHAHWVKKNHRYHWLQEREGKNYFTGFVLYDPLKEEVIYEYNGDKYFTPASNTKIFTFYTAHRLLGDSIPSFKYLARGDTLFISGLGDPTLFHPEFDNTRLIRFLSQEYDCISILPQVVEDKPYGPGWSWDDFNYSYQRARSDFPLYGNAIRFIRDTITSKWQSLPILPKEAVRYKHFDSTENFRSVMRIGESNIFELPIHYPEMPEQQDVPFIPSMHYLAKLLGDTLGLKVIFQSSPLASSSTWKTFNSQAADTVLRKMMQESDNFLAEQLLWISSAQKYDTLSSRKIIHYVLDTLLVDIPQRPQWVDGSGLSRYNLMTPLSVVYVLTQLYREIDLDSLLGTLAAGGVSGTIENWYAGEEKPFVFAKTGTLSNNHNLSGFLLTKKGKILIFSFMHNHYVSSVSPVKQEMEHMLLELYNKF